MNRRYAGSACSLVAALLGPAWAGSAFPPQIDLPTLRPENGGDGSVGFFIRGIVEDDETGNSVDVIGDFNGDGIDDMVIGAVDVDVGAQTAAGGAYILFGRPGGFPAQVNLADLLPPAGDGSDGVILLGREAFDEAGSSVRGAGDVNGDGLADVLIGAPGVTSPNRFNAGVAYLIFGARTNPPLLRLADIGDGSRGTVLIGFGTDSRTGETVAGVGDVNGDGVDDFMVGAPNDDLVDNQAGVSYLLFGRTTPYPPSIDLASLLPSAGGDGSAGVVFLGTDPLDRAGFVVGGFDLNDDGLGDFAVGARGSDGGGPPEANEGSIFVVYGSDSGFPPLIRARSLLPEGGGNGSVGLAIEGINRDDESAFSGAGGDLNGDGVDDLVVTSTRASSSAGEAYVVFGRRTPFGPVFELQDLLPSTGTLVAGDFDFELAFLPDGGSDLNGDGLDDFVIAGASDLAAIVFGRPQYPLNFPVSRLLAAQGGDGSEGVVLAGANGSDDQVVIATGGDLNGDGIDDVLVGASDFDSDRGAVYVVYGVAPQRQRSGD